LLQAEHLREQLPGFTAHFVSWVANQLEQGDLKTDIANRFNVNMRGYREKLAKETGGQSNTGRVIQNWAVLVTVYQMLSRFLSKMDEDYLLPAWQDAIVESVRTLRQERASEMFLNVLGQIIGSGQCVIEPSLRVKEDPSPGHVVAGYRDESFIYLLPDVALREVNKVQPLRFTAYAIGTQLKEDGLLLPGKTNLTVQRSVRGSVIRLWRLKAEILGCEGCDPCDDDD